jgi:hypothetical protein
VLRTATAALAATAVAGLGLASCDTSTTATRATPTRTPAPTSTPTASTSPAPASTTYQVRVVPAEFSADVTNPWFPLPPGRTLVYTGVSDGEPVREVVEVTEETQLVGGVRCRVVVDRVYESGELAETTRDYYAQHRDGTVWYFGEDTATLLEGGRMESTEGTWHAGVLGAQPGIVMGPAPTVGERHRQEYLRGIAEDFYEVTATGLTVRVPYRTFTGALRTKEWSPLEPGVVAAKIYARGIGMIKELNVTGGNEQLSLTSVSG